MIDISPGIRKCSAIVRRMHCLIQGVGVFPPLVEVESIPQLAVLNIVVLDGVVAANTANHCAERREVRPKKSATATRDQLLG